MLAPELIYETESGDDRFTFSPFYRFDADDPERTHWDIREALRCAREMTGTCRPA